MIATEGIATLIGILILASLVEAITEYLVQPAIKPATQSGSMQPEPGGVDWRGLVLRYTSAAVGITLCVLYRADLLAMLGLESPIPLAGWIITGLLVGRGGNFINDFADRWLRPMK